MMMMMMMMMMIINFREKPLVIRWEVIHRKLFKIIRRIRKIGKKDYQLRNVCTSVRPQGKKNSTPTARSFTKHDISSFFRKFIHSLVFSLRGRVSRNQSPVMWPVWLWHTASWASAWGGSLPLLSPAFRRSHFRRQVPVRPQRRERS